MSNSDPEPRPAETEQAEAQQAEAQQAEAQRREARLRRAPRYRVFIGTGAGLGAVVGAILALLNPVAGGYTERAIIGYLATTLALIGALLGASVAVLLERRR